MKISPKPTIPVDLATLTYLLPADISSNKLLNRQIESEPSNSSVRAHETTYTIMTATNSETISKNSELNVS